MPTIHIKDEKELAAFFLELSHTAHNMRFWQKYWHENFGGDAKKQREYWEKKMDALLDRLGLEEHNRLNSIKISPNAENT